MPVRPVVTHFPVVLPEGFEPKVTDCVNAQGRPCTLKIKYGGGFLELRGPKRLKHHALDIMGPIGAHILSVGPGKVIKAGHTPKGGHCVTIRDPNGFTWYYAHMDSSPVVGEGGEVVGGQLLGYLGRSGNASRPSSRRPGTVYGCPHLHVSLTGPRGAKRDPKPLLRSLPGGPR